jgi:hypothetical protein
VTLEELEIIFQAETEEHTLREEETMDNDQEGKTQFKSSVP